MLKRLSAALLLGGLLSLTPIAAMAAPERPTEATESASGRSQAYDLYHHRDDNHYRCSGFNYSCNDRYGRDRHRYPRHRDCRYHDRWGRYRDRCTYEKGSHREWDDSDSAHASGGYDSHRQHSDG